jgi:hypothetical protein
VVIDGSGINLNAVDGFPALIVTGTVTVKNYSGITINGLASVDGGILSYGATPYASLTVNGGVVSKTVGFDYGVRGTHTVNFNAQKSDIYDLSGNSPYTLDATIVSFAE